MPDFPAHGHIYIIYVDLVKDRCTASTDNGKDCCTVLVALILVKIVVQ